MAFSRDSQLPNAFGKSRAQLRLIFIPMSPVSVEETVTGPADNMLATTGVLTGYQDLATNKAAFQMTSKSRTPPGTSKLVHAAFGMYLVSYSLPAVVIAGDLLFGFMATFLSFVGMFDWGLERGQAPACLLGALANVLMFGGYGYYNLRRFSWKLRHSYRMVSWLAGLAAVCALGATVFLATGSETFVPHVGHFSWLGSMIIMSFTCRKLEKTVNCESSGPQLPIIGISKPRV